MGPYTGNDREGTISGPAFRGIGEQRINSVPTEEWDMALVASLYNRIHAAALRSLSQGPGLDLAEFVHQDHAWQRAARLSIAEGAPGWNVLTENDSPAMIAVRRLRASLAGKDEKLKEIDAITTGRIGEPPHDRQKRLHNGELGCDGINHFDHLDEIQAIAREARKEQP